MKKVLLVLFASVALYFVACKSGNKDETHIDSTETQEMVNDAMNAVDSMKHEMDQMADSVAAMADSLAEKM